MNKLYNGVELQEIPQRGETFSHSLIYSTVEDSKITVLFTETAVALRTLSPLNFDVTYRNNAVYELNDSEGWKLRREEYGPVDGVDIGEIIWANYDVLDPDGNVYLAASEPLVFFGTTHTIHVDLLQRGVRPKVDVVQGDTMTRRLDFELTAGGVPWAPPDGTNAALSYIRPDGVGRVYDRLDDGTEAYTVSDNHIRMMLLPEVLQVAGDVMAVLQIIRRGDGKLISTFPVDITVEADPSYTVRPGGGTLWEPVSVIAEKDRNEITITAAYASGKTETSVIALDAVGNPVSVTKDGVTTALNWEGFDE